MKNLPSPDPRVDTDEYRAYWLPLFQRSAKEPIVWAMTGDALLDAARLLKPQIEAYLATVTTSKVGDSVPPGHNLAPVYMMLVGFAAENFLKGILIGRQPARVGPAKLTKWEGGGHDLIELARLAEVKLNSDEQEVLLALTVHAEWQGRYPCPLKHEDRLPRPTKGGGFAPLGVVRSSHLNSALDLCVRFRQILDDERANTSPRRAAQHALEPTART